MCVKAWKLHHSSNQMCKDTWIPTARQTAAAFVLDKVLLTFQWSPSNWKVHFWDNQRGGKCHSSGDGKRPWPCKERAAPSPAQVHSGHQFTSPWAVTARRQICSETRALHPPKNHHRRLGHPSTQEPAMGSLQKRPNWLLPALGRGAGLALQRPSLS